MATDCRFRLSAIYISAALQEAVEGLAFRYHPFRCAALTCHRSRASLQEFPLVYSEERPRSQTARLGSLETMTFGCMIEAYPKIRVTYRRMAKKKRARFNPKKEVSVMAWIEDDKGSVLLVRQVVGQRLWTLPGGKVKRNESLECPKKARFEKRPA